MICKGNLHGNGRALADYLQHEKKGELTELVELRGFATARHLCQAFIDVESEAQATCCRKPFFHSYVRLPEGERLSRKAWLYCADRIEEKLKFTGQSRAIVFHHVGGATHMHIAWSRIDRERMRAIDPGLYKNRLKEICRALEQELGLTPVRNQSLPGRKTRSAGRKEFEEARRLGTDLNPIRETIRACWDCSADGHSFAAALEEQGSTLARGDRLDFVVVDQKGCLHALSKRITGVPVPQMRRYLADIDLEQLPGVEKARTQLRDTIHKFFLRPPQYLAERAVLVRHSRIEQ